VFYSNFNNVHSSLYHLHIICVYRKYQHIYIDHIRYIGLQHIDENYTRLSQHMAIELSINRLYCTHVHTQRIITTN